MNETIGLATMKTRIASKNSATPPQKRLGICGMRISLPASNGPPRSNGSNGRYRRDIVLKLRPTREAGPPEHGRQRRSRRLCWRGGARAGSELTHVVFRMERSSFTYAQPV